jgi:hypothetical protein
LKCFFKTLLSVEPYEEENKQVNPIDTHEKESPTNPKKNHG